MEAERLPRGVRRERHLKLGKGGLSDVEWTVQLMQLQHAGDIKDLRVNGTLEALDVLEAKKLISAIDAIQLRKAWTLCTAARNGSYLWSGRANQADILPDDIYSLGGIAVLWEDRRRGGCGNHRHGLRRNAAAANRPSPAYARDRTATGTKSTPRAAIRQHIRWIFRWTLGECGCPKNGVS